MISLFGYGKTTKALAKKLKNCQIFDDNFLTCNEDEFGNKLLPPSLFKAHESSLEIPSPSFPLNHPLMSQANNITSEYDYFAQDMPYSVWISGTNGKTTTTQMLQHLLGNRGSCMGGNIGVPLAELDVSAPLWILETSSYMMHHTKRATPGLYLLLPIKPDHIKYHGSYEAYESSKLSPLARMQEGSVVILPECYSQHPTNAYTITYKDEKDLAKTMGIDLESLFFKPPFLLDALMAMSADKILFDMLDYDKINAFKTDAHKLEEFFDGKQRLWVNDSKGTNIDATQEALRRYKDKEILLILGGDDKGVDTEPLLEALKPLHVKLFTIGQTAQSLTCKAKEIGKEALTCKTLEEAVKQIDKIHTQSSVALLSPATSSFDQFDSYVHRGECFKELVLHIF